MTDIKKREYILWLTKKKAKELGLPIDKNNFGHKIVCGGIIRKLQDKVLEYKSEEIASIGYKDGDGMKQIKMLSVYSESTEKQVRTKEEAMDEILRSSLDQMIPNKK